jgi:acetyl-CoA acetyltransferase
VKITPKDLSRQTAIISLGTELRSKKHGHERISGLELQARACAKAIRAAGLKPSDIGGLFTGRPPNENINPQWSMVMLDALKIAPKISTSVSTHGAGHLATIKFAALAVATGVIDYAVCCSGAAAPYWLRSASAVPFLECDSQFEAPFRPLTPALYAQWASRYVHEFGVTPEQAARVTVEARKWAVHHPDAAMRDKGLITIADVVNSPMIATPFHLLDCAPWYPGGMGVAVVVTRSELAHRHDQPIYIHGFGECSTHESITERVSLRNVPPATHDSPNITTTGAAVAAQDAYAMSGWKPKDVDILQTQAPFTYMILMALEDLGFCAKGEAGRFVEAGGIDYEGGLPTNTSGGMLGWGQPNNTNPLLAEAIEQLRGQAKGKQVAGAARALVHFHGGPFAAHAVTLLSTAA